MAGQTATHSIVYARLLIDKYIFIIHFAIYLYIFRKDYGIHTFVVPLRNLETGVPLEGINIGDCGAKMVCLLKIMRNNVNREEMD